ncbi:MAG: hypothetical protein M0C28_13760 [Candidatus Moduliflexus flocculans]|nr:hypothetical protein [Candidatus Moduliflexus flocculans]
MMIVRRPALTFTAAGLSVVLALAAVAASCTTAAKGQRPVQLSPCSRAFVFVDHGRPAATIVIRENAGEVERRAADILRISVLKMSGVDLPIRSAAAPGRPNIAAVGFPLRGPAAGGHIRPPRASSGRLRRGHCGRESLYHGRRREGRDLRRRAPPREVLRLPALQPDGRALPAA